jgi:hypothetical protein
MKAFKHHFLRLVAVLVVLTSGIRLSAQLGASTSQADSIAVSIALDKDHFPVGQSPLVILKMNNLTDQDLYLHGDWLQLHIEGENGEPPTTLRQRMATGKLLPGEARLRDDEYSQEVISSGGSRTQTIYAKYLYDLSVLGRYTVYVDVKDPLSGRWLRTKTEKFEIQAQ